MNLLQNAPLLGYGLFPDATIATAEQDIINLFLLLLICFQYYKFLQTKTKCCLSSVSLLFLLCSKKYYFITVTMLHTLLFNRLNCSRILWTLKYIKYGCDKW